MRFFGSTTECEDCGRKISQEDNADFMGDSELCGACAALKLQEAEKMPCGLCSQPLGREEAWCDENQDAYVHKTCAEKDPELKVNPEKWGEIEY